MTLTPETIARVRSALEAFVDSAPHTQVFLQSRERMHPSGLRNFAADVGAARGALSAIDRELSRGDLQGAIEQETKELKGE